MKPRSNGARAQLLRAACASLVLGGCSTVLGLGSLERVDCVDECGGASGSGNAANAPNAGSGQVATGGSSGNAGAPTNNGGSAASLGGSEPGAGEAGVTFGDAGAGGTAPLDPTKCPGGPVPAEIWTENWFEHKQVLSRVSYDDCAAIYFDFNMAPNATTWLSPFVSKAWEYSVKTYGNLGPERVYAVFHQGTYSGGHSATFREKSHGFHNVIDGAATDWTQNYQDMTLTLLGFLVEGNGSHTKFGSPASALSGPTKWEEIYKYDAYIGLGLNDQAAVALTKFNAISSSTPRANTFWFRDWFYPLWRDRGHAQVFVRFFSLLEQYYPAVDQEMADMNWGEYVHFMSGAAKTNLKARATTAFGWDPAWEDQFQQAQTDYPKITY